MIKNINEIIAQRIKESERILVEYMEKLLSLDEQKDLTINTAEVVLKEMVSNFITLGLTMTGEALSNIVVENTDTHCSCGKKLIKSKQNAEIKILSSLGYIPIVRDLLFCRRCHKGYGVIDKEIEIYGRHRVTKSMTEIITYIGQLMPFKEASETIKKLIGIDVSPTQIHIISEEIGKKIFQKDLAEADNSYEKPEEAAPQELDMYRKEGRLCVLVDGSQVNTRIKDSKGSSWKEMKLGLIFSDKDMIKTESGSNIITRKEYIPYFGSVSEFKKFLFAAAGRAGYGKIKEIVVIGDGAQWIWNMCKEVFPDAVEILDFYHFSENTNDYAKALFPDNEVKRKAWVNELISLVKSDNTEEAIRFVEESKIEKLPDDVVNLGQYILNNSNRIKYKYLMDNNYFIGSGAIESGNKTVIQSRMKQSGMRWSINGGQYIATLRGKYKSGLWDEVVKLITGS